MSIVGSIKDAFASGWMNDKRITNLSLNGKGTLYSPMIKNHADDYSNTLRKIATFKGTYPSNLFLDNDIGYDLTTNDYSNNNYYENGFKIPANIIHNISKYYKFVYERQADYVLDYGIPHSYTDPNSKATVVQGGEKATNAYGTDGDITDITLQTQVISLPVVPSLFNPFYGINVVGITENTPLLDNFTANGEISTLYDESNSNEERLKSVQITNSYNKKISEDISDCSIKKLVELSNKGKMGRGIYKYADFMYCKDLGKYSNNRLITLRRFPVPVGDDIWNIGSPTDSSDDANNSFKVKLPLDTGRLVTWLNDTNKIEDILKYEVKDLFESREGRMMDTPSQEDQADRGIVGSLVNLANPTYRQRVGTGFAGGGNMILDRFSGVLNNKFFSANSTNQSSNVLTMYDQNKVYEPQATTRDTHIWNGQLTFSQNFSLTFDYELRAYENINPRTALLDLLNNVLQVTYRSGKFFGGQVWLAGAPGNQQGWNMANALIDGTFDKVSDVFDSMLRGTLNIGDFIGNITNKITSAITEGAKSLSSSLTNPTGEDSIGNKLANSMKKFNVGGMLRGMIKNKLGRPAIYTTNSILSGDPVGLWHLTIGNPRNPILSMGNMIIDGSTIQHYGPLGIDDFPTGLKVTVNLKHGRSRDMIEIGKMYTMGTIGLGVPLGRTRMSEMHNGWSRQAINIDALMYSTSFASPVPQLSNGIRSNSSE